MKESDKQARACLCEHAKKDHEEVQQPEKAKETATLVDQALELALKLLDSTGAGPVENRPGHYWASGFTALNAFRFVGWLRAHDLKTPGQERDGDAWRVRFSAPNDNA